MPPPRITIFVPNLEDHPPQRAMVLLANGLHRRGYAVDVAAPMGGGPLRAALDPRIGQIDLARRHAATSVLSLARILAERRPAALLAPDGDAGVAAMAATVLARKGTALAVLGRRPESPGAMRTLLHRLLPTCALLDLRDGDDSDIVAERCLAAVGLPGSLVPRGADGDRP